MLGPLSHSREIIFLTQSRSVSRHKSAGKTFGKIPHKNEGGGFGGLRQPAKLWGNVAASVEIVPQILATKKDK